MLDNFTEADLEAGRRALLGGGVGGGMPVVIARGEGARVWDTRGNEYIDCTAQAWSLNVGYSHPKVIAAVTEQIKRYTHVRMSFETAPKLLLAKRLAELAPGNLKKVSYALTGSDANEGAMKLAMRNRPGNTFVSLWDAYHGRTLATTALSWSPPNNRFTAWAGPVLRVPQPYCYRCPLHLQYPSCGIACADLARDLIQNSASELPLAWIMEPVQGNGGMIDFPLEYHARVREICDEFNILLIWDEIQTGFGRVGEWFASNLYRTIPDIMVIGKGLGGGFPLYATLSREDLQPFAGGDQAFTFAHFPVSMVAGLAAIQVIEEENLNERARVLGVQATRRLREMQDKYELIGDVRGPGLMIGVELVKDRKTKEPAIQEAQKLIKMALERGVIFAGAKYSGMSSVVKIKPPLVIREAELARALDVFEEIIQKLMDE